jgi:hypothetical protein
VVRLPYKKPSWQEKLEDCKDFPKVEPIPSRMTKNRGTGTLVIPAPIEVDQLMRKVPIGKLTTINDIRIALAKKHHATIGCPLTTGIFASIAAHAAEDKRQQGKADLTPYWRTLKTGGLINEKYPGGFDLQKFLLESEGHLVIQRCNKFYVKDYLKDLASLDQ